MEGYIPVDENRLDELLDYVADECLICPKKHDISSEKFTQPCCHNSCFACWKDYLTE